MHFLGRDGQDSPLYTRDMEMQTGFTEGKLGLRLFHRWHPAAEARATLVFVHGFGEHSGRYQHVFEAMNEAGFNCFGFDYRGHGRAEGRRSYINRYSEYLADVDTALALVRERVPEAPVFLVGHSQGGLIVATWVLERGRGGSPLAGMVLSSPSIAFAVEVPSWKDALGQLMATLWPTLEMPSGLDPALVSRDRAVVEAYRADPLVHSGATARWYTESMRAQRRIAEGAAHIRLPTLVLQAGDDRLCDPAATRRFFEALGAADKQLVEYEGWYHEVFSEPDKERAFSDLVAWLDAHLA